MYRPVSPLGVLAAAALWLLCSVPVAAEPVDDFHTWGAVVATGAVGGADSALRFWAEGQGRFNDDSSRRNQGLLRVAGGYEIAPRTVLWAGYGYFTTDPIGVPDAIVEHRIWQQLTWRAAQPIAGVTVSTRSRLEQRMIESAEETGWRARQLVKLSYPLSAGERVYLALWDEVFINLDDTDWGADDGFDQNRAFAGLGFKLAPHLRSEVGYMNQYVARANRDDASNHVLSLTLFLDF